MSEKRNTIQQKIILTALKKLNTHPTVEDVYAEVQKTHPKISMTTVYRNLHKLAENGEIRQISPPNEMERYDRRIDGHYHFKCRECGKIFDVDIDYLAGINETVQQKYGFQIEEHDVIFKGICRNCMK